MDSGKPTKHVRAKVHEHSHVETGKGLPHIVTKNLRNQTDSMTKIGGPGPSRSDDSARYRRTSLRKSFFFGGPTALAKRSVVSNLATRLDLDEYDFPEDDGEEPSAMKDLKDTKMDVTALDRYNDDIRRLRKMLIEECRSLPQRGELDDLKMTKIKMIVRGVCRTCYYGTHRAQILAEGAAILIVWLLNRKNISMNIKLHILQSFAEMLWTSPDLKQIFHRCNGVRLIAKLLVNGVKHKSELSQWACYTLAMASTNSVEVVETLQDISQFDEVVGEIAFYTYWTNWPANFGQILQGIVFGPHSVIAVEDIYDFV